MTTVNLKYRRIDGVTLEGTLVTSGLVEVTPAYRSDTGSGQMTTIADTFPVGSTVVLAPGTYLFKLRASDGHGGRLKDEGVYRLVPASGTFDVDDLAEVTPTAGSMTQSDVAAMIAAAVAGLIVGPGGTPTGTGTGGQFWIQDVLDSTATGRALVKAVDAAAGRSAIGAAAAANAVFTGTVTVPDNSLAIADTSGLQTALDLKAPLASPALTGTPTVPTATAGTNTTQAASTAFVTTAVSGVVDGGGGAPLASPAFTGTPTAPTATLGTNTIQLATTAFVQAALVALLTRLDDLETLNTSLSSRVQELEENGANQAAIIGAAATRNNPLTGTSLNPGTVVTWLVDGTAPTNAATGDIVLNRVSI